MASKNLIEMPRKIRNLQRTLYRQAKGNAKWKAWSLYGDLCRSDILTYALKRVIDNAGAPGVDGMRIETLKDDAEKRDEFLENLQNELKAKGYKPSPVRRVYNSKGEWEIEALRGSSCANSCKATAGTDI